MYMQEHSLLSALLWFFLIHYFPCAALNNNITVKHNCYAMIESPRLGFFITTVAVIGSCLALSMAIYMQWIAFKALLRTIRQHYNRKKSNLCVDKIKPMMEKKSSAIDEDDDITLMITWH
ncbi:Cytochrome c biogenesis protein CcsA [Trichinella pseudospiralis]